MPRPKRTNRTPKKRTKPDWAPRFLRKLSVTSNISAACKAAGIGRTAFYERRDSDPVFAAAAAEALETATDALELEARRRALEGVTKPIFGSGGKGVGSVQVGEVQEYSDTLMIFLLKAHRPEKFRENVKHEHVGELKHEHEHQFTEEQRQQALDRIAARLGLAPVPPPGSASAGSAGPVLDGPQFGDA